MGRIVVKLGEDDDRYVMWVSPPGMPGHQGDRKATIAYLIGQGWTAEQAHALVDRADDRGSSCMGDGTLFWDGAAAVDTPAEGGVHVTRRLPRSLLDDFCQRWNAGDFDAAYELTI